MSDLNEKGAEVFDQTPVAFPFKFERPLPLHLRIRQQILQAMAQMQHAPDVETPEEADDFNVPDDPEMWNSPYEQDFDHINADLHMLSAASKEEDAPAASSDGATQAEGNETDKA